MKFIVGGGLRVDFLITPDGQAHERLPGGNSVYAAVGAALWADEIILWARRGENYADHWLHELSEYSIDITRLVNVPGDQDHRTFFAYLPDGRRDDTNPATHYERINQPLPPELEGYIHSTPGQDDPLKFEPLALRPADWHFSNEVLQGDTAVNFSPLALATHLQVPPVLRQAGVSQITVDPGERYMIPQRTNYIRQLLPQIDAFLPSTQEVRSLFGSTVDLQKAAATLCEWGTPLVVIKDGANGVILQQGVHGPTTQVPAYHQPGDPRVVDITGAGDSFCGGFMVGLAQSGDPRTAVCMGLVSASLVIEGYGAMYALSIGKQTAQTRLAEIL